jgi:hypothetical protein
MRAVIMMTAQKEASPRGTAAGGHVADRAQCPRHADGAAPLGRALPLSMEAAEARVLGGPIPRPERAATAGAGPGSAATSGTTTIEGASAGRPQRATASVRRRRMPMRTADGGSVLAANGDRASSHLARVLVRTVPLKTPTNRALIHPPQPRFDRTKLRVIETIETIKLNPRMAVCSE